MLNLNKVQAVQSSHLFSSNVISDSRIDSNLSEFEDYRDVNRSEVKLSGKVKTNLSIAYFLALTVMIFLLFA